MITQELENTSEIAAAEVVISEVKYMFDPIQVIVSPPRCASTAIARLFWQHPLFGHYAHEPFETKYFRKASLIESMSNIRFPIDLSEKYKTQSFQQCNGLVIKEMPYQVGNCFNLLTKLTSGPIIFLIRDPRLSVYSRMQKKTEAGTSPIFPEKEIGFSLLMKQIIYCRQNGHDFVIVDSTDFRAHPQVMAKALLDRLGLPYYDSVLHWSSAESMPLDNLDGDHNHLYTKVLGSTGLLPPLESIPQLDDFPEEGDMRTHVADALRLYNDLKNAPERLVISD